MVTHRRKNSLEPLEAHGETLKKEEPQASGNTW
jgi:hypothetical protein